MGPPRQEKRLGTKMLGSFFCACKLEILFYNMWSCVYFAGSLTYFHQQKKRNHKSVYV